MGVTPMKGADVAIYSTSLTPVAATNEAMNEIDDTWLNHPRYTVYEITAKAHRYLTKSVTPTWQKKIHGAGEWVAISSSDIKEVQCPGGRLVLKAALNADDTVQMATGSCLAATAMAGTFGCKLDLGRDIKKYSLHGASSVTKFAALTDPKVSIDSIMLLNRAYATTAQTGNNNDYTIRHMPGGTEGNGITLTHVDPAGNNASLSVAVVGTDITVNLATDGSSNPTSTAAQVIAALNASVDFRNLGLVATLKSGDDGTGVCTAFTAITTAQGANPKDWNTDDLLIVIVYLSEDNDIRAEGYGYVQAPIEMPADDLLKQAMTIEIDGDLYWRLS